MGVQVKEVLNIPVQQFGSLFGSGPMPALQALLHPTGNPIESNGPLSGGGPSRYSIVRLSDQS